jgi:lysozyme
MGIIEATPSSSETDAPRARQLLKKIVLRVLIIPVVLALVAGALWRWWVPHYRPSLKNGEHYGIDVSHHQNKIDWPAVANDHITFAYIKATEGDDYVDSAFQANWIEARNAGLDVGGYHFFSLCTPGLAQAKNFIRQLTIVNSPASADSPPAVNSPESTGPPSKGKFLAPAVDFEFSGGCSKRPPINDVKKEAKAFVEEVERITGQTLLVYSVFDFEKNYPIQSILKRPFWQRHLFHRPSSNNWTVWQVSGWANVRGIQGPVDLDIGRL